MHPIDFVDIRDMAGAVSEINYSMSTMLRSVIAVPNDHDRRAQLIVLSAAAELASDKAEIIQETTSRKTAEQIAFYSGL